MISDSTMIPPRSFNRISIDSMTGSVRKSTARPAALRDEYDWYRALPASLRDLIPQVLDWQDDGTTAQLVLARVPAIAVASLYLERADAPDWRSLLSDVATVQDRLHHHRRPVERDDIRAMYVTKTRRRLEEQARQSRHWKSLLTRRDVVCNGVVLPNVITLWPLIERRVEALARNTTGAIIHGDFCFSNILWNPSSDGSITLVDPRGRFGAGGLAGDPRYDAAKLRHSAVGGYDLITADRFSVRWDGGEIVGDLRPVESSPLVASVTDDLLRARGYDLSEVTFIESLLFLSMIPLHADAPPRQIMMFLTGLTRLHEALA